MIRSMLSDGSGLTVSSPGDTPRQQTSPEVGHSEDFSTHFEDHDATTFHILGKTLYNGESRVSPKYSLKQRCNGAPQARPNRELARQVRNQGRYLDAPEHLIVAGSSHENKFKRKNRDREDRAHSSIRQVECVAKDTKAARRTCL